MQMCMQSMVCPQRNRIGNTDHGQQFTLPEKTSSFTRTLDKPLGDNPGRVHRSSMGEFALVQAALQWRSLHQPEQPLQLTNDQAIMTRTGTTFSPPEPVQNDVQTSSEYLKELAIVLRPPACHLTVLSQLHNVVS